MSNITKFGIGAVMACDAAISTVAPAAAQVSFGIGIGPLAAFSISGECSTCRFQLN